jgi:undecaprenyl-diphosphatase
MLAVTCYSLFLKDWDFKGKEMHGYEMISSSTNNMLIFVLGNIIAFVVAIVAIRFFISLIDKFGFRIWGWYRIVVGVILLLLFTI